MATPADVAAALEIPIPRLRWLAYHSEASKVNHYVRFTVPKKSGGTRALFAPRASIAAAQRWILDNILILVPVHEAANGFVKGRSTLTNALPHVGKDVVANVDLEDFFPTITFPRVKGIFQGLGYSPAVAVVLALLCTECPRRMVQYQGETFHVATGPRGLPQGASTSPALSNLVARRLDARASGLCRKLGWTYSRYADDLTFSVSGEQADRVGYLLARIRHIVQEEGFVLNEKKTRILRRHAAQTVTGIVVNDKPGTPRQEIRRVRAIVHCARKDGIGAQNREKHPNFTQWLQGKIAYISMVSPRRGRNLKNDLQAL
jgi:retron-type reverse transcriptase